MENDILATERILGKGINWAPAGEPVLLAGGVGGRAAISSRSGLQGHPRACLPAGAFIDWGKED